MAYRKFSNKNLANALKLLYLNEAMCDVHFVFESHDGRTERVPAHKNLLIATSKVFRTMFNGSWKERDNNVRIVDATVDSFKEFLQFFYFDEIEQLTMANIAEVINLAQKYDVAGCLNACSRFLEYNMTADNVCVVYGLAILYDQMKLKRICEMTIAIDTIAVFGSPCFLECQPEVLHHILKLNLLSCSETDVFNACMAWVRTASKAKTLTKSLVRNHLGASFYDIRFGSMKMEEFIAIFLMNRHLFPFDEHKDIILKIMSTEHQPQYFNGMRRQSSSWDKITPKIRCIREYDDAPEFEHNINGEPITTTFHMNETLLLRDIVCAEMFQFENWPLSLRQDLTGKLTIFETRGRCNTKEVTTVLYVDSNIKLIANRCTVIQLTKPVIIRRGIKYNIQLDLNLPFRCCSLVNFKNAEVHIGDDDIVVKFSKDIVKNGKRRGVIYGLQFSRY